MPFKFNIELFLQDFPVFLLCCISPMSPGIIHNKINWNIFIYPMKDFLMSLPISLINLSMKVESHEQSLVIIVPGGTLLNRTISYNKTYLTFLFFFPSMIFLFLVKKSFVYFTHLEVFPEDVYVLYKKVRSFCLSRS